MATKKGTAQKKTPAKRKAQDRYVRNIRNVRVTLRAQDRRIDLAPRGQRNDLAPLNKGDKDDENFMADLGSLFELITKAEAEQVREKQSTNRQAQHHAARDIIRNEHGDPYEDDAITVEEEFNQEQGKAVAPLDDQGHLTIDRTGIRRAEIPGSQENPLPEIPDSIAPEDQAEYLRTLKVTKEPTQKGTQ
jgi:hypothetical protein